MTPHLAHFAINATDVPASRRFYEAVFGWDFVPWGPPGFFQIATGEATGETAASAVIGALQQHRTFDATGRSAGIECTFAVDDVDQTRAAVLEAGGVILLDRFTIAGVGHLIFFIDPDGTPVGAMQYDEAAM